MLDYLLGLLMKASACRNPKDMHYKVLADRVRYFKEDEKGVGAMCKAVEDLVKEEVIEMVESMLELGVLTMEQIALVSKLTLEEVKEIAEKREQQI